MGRSPLPNGATTRLPTANASRNSWDRIRIGMVERPIENDLRKQTDRLRWGFRLFKQVALRGGRRHDYPRANQTQPILSIIIPLEGKARRNEPALLPQLQYHRFDLPQAFYNVLNFMESDALPARPRALTADGRLLFATRCLRLFAYGLLSRRARPLPRGTGSQRRPNCALLTLTLLGDTVVSLWLTTTADRLGRRRMLIIGGMLMVFAGILFAATDNFWLLLLAATIGVISPSGNEVGPFLPIEQAALSQTLTDERRTTVFAWYNLVGSLSTAVGALCGGLLTQSLSDFGLTGPSLYRPVVLVYGSIGLLLVLVFAMLSPAAEVQRAATQPPPRPALLGLHRSRGVVLRLSGLFALDAFGGGFVIQTIIAYWFHVRFDADPALLGGIFFGANLFAGFSARGRLAGESHRFAQHDGIHPFAIECAVDPGAVHAQSGMGNRGFAAAFQHFPDGRAGPPVVHDGRGQPRGTLGRIRRDRRRPLGGGVHFTIAGHASAWKPHLDGRSAVRFRGGNQDRL